jgi:predicted small secreted protein
MIRSVHTKLFALMLVGAALLTACDTAQPVVTVDIQAQITQTMRAVATDAQATLLASVPTPAPPTATIPPTATTAPTATIEPTPAPTEDPGLVATASAAALSGTTVLLNESTNCRTGPSPYYPLVFTAQKNATLKIVSNTSVSKYVIIANPDNPGQTCWLWTEYATVAGDLASLPVVTPPSIPTPEVAYGLSYYRVETCNEWSVAFKITNTGLKTLNSYKVVAEDLTENTQQTTSSNNFDRRNGCVVEETITSLDPGESGYIYAHDFNFDIDEHSMRATVTVCTHNDLGGACVMQVIYFTP